MTDFGGHYSADGEKGGGTKPKWRRHYRYHSERSAFPASQLVITFSYNLL